MVSPHWIKHKQSFLYVCQPSLYNQSMLDTHRLAIWRAVVASGSVHQAAANLQYTPATISQHIIRLQTEVGLPLYERKGRGIVPTPVGVRLAEESGEVFSSLRRLESTLEDLRRGPRPRLEIGCFSSAAKEWIPAIVSSVVTEFPTVQFEISLSPATDAEDWHPHDLEIHSEEPSLPPTTVPGFRRQVLTEEDYLLVVAADHRLAGAEAVSMSELHDESWVAADISNTPAGLIITRACNAAGYEPRYAAGSDDHYAVLAMVAAGVGVSALPPLAIRTLPDGVTTVPLTDPTPRRRIVLQTREAVHHHEYVRTAEELIRARAQAS